MFHPPSFPKSTLIETSLSSLATVRKNTPKGKKSQIIQYDVSSLKCGSYENIPRRIPDIPGRIPKTPGRAPGAPGNIANIPRSAAMPPRSPLMAPRRGQTAPGNIANIPRSATVPPRSPMTAPRRTLTAPGRPILESAGRGKRGCPFPNSAFRVPLRHGRRAEVFAASARKDFLVGLLVVGEAEVCGIPAQLLAGETRGFCREQCGLGDAPADVERGPERFLRAEAVVGPVFPMVARLALRERFVGDDLAFAEDGDFPIGLEEERSEVRLPGRGSNSKFQVQSSKFSPPQARCRTHEACEFEPASNHAPPLPDSVVVPASLPQPSESARIFRTIPSSHLMNGIPLHGL